jgi:ribose transport system substrate-binding protein
MKTKLTVALVIAMAALLLLAPACRRQSTGGKRVIAVIPKGTSHFFWQSVHAGAETAAKEAGVEIMWKGPEHEIDYAAQINIVEDAINRRVDGIVLAPTHKDALVPIVDRAQRENIPVAIFDSGIGTENYVSYIATNNLQGGAVAADQGHARRPRAEGGSSARGEALKRKDDQQNFVGPRGITGGRPD